MFFFKSEKEEMRITIQSLQASVRELSVNSKSMRLAIIDLEKKVDELSKSKRKRGPVIKTPDAPYGRKADGTPRKKAGRPKVVMTVSQP